MIVGDAAPVATASRRSPKWGVLLLLCTGVMISFLDRSSISAVIANEHFISYFNLSQAERGWVGAAFFWSYALAQAPMGWIVDRYGIKYPYAICFTLWCAATAAAGAMTVLAGLIIMRLLVGVAEAIVMPASYRWIRLNIPERHTGTAVALFLMGNQIGTAVGAPLAAWLIVQYDWRVMFFVTGLVALLWLIPWFYTVPSDLPSKAEMAAAKKRASSVPLRNIIVSPVVWGAMIFIFCYSYFLFYCMTWMPSYLVERRGLSLSQSGLYTFFSFAGIAIVSVASGWLADRIIDRGFDSIVTRKAFVLAGLAGASTVLFGAYAHSLEAALFWNIFSLSCLGLASANSMALIKVTLVPAPAIGLVVGVMHLAAGLSGGASSSLSGWLLQTSGGYDLPLQVIVAFLALGAGVTIFLLRPEWSPKVVAEAEPV